MAITQADVEAVFGVNNVAQWSSFGSGTQAVADTARVARAIAWAESMVNASLINGPYAIPLVNADLSGNEVPEILDAKATWAGWWLWKTRGLNQAKETVKEMNDMNEKIRKLLLKIKTGVQPINALYNTGRTSAPFVARNY